MRKIKEEFKMKTFIKYAAIGLVTYFVGFYEAKYKALKVIVEKYDEANEDSQKKKEES